MRPVVDLWATPLSLSTPDIRSCSVDAIAAAARAIALDPVRPKNLGPLQWTPDHRARDLGEAAVFSSAMTRWSRPSHSRTRMEPGLIRRCLANGSHRSNARRFLRLNRSQ